MINEIQLIRDLEHMKEKEDLGVPCSIDNIIALVEKQPKVNEWIPADKALPEDGKTVLCWYEYFRFGNYNRMYQDYGIGWQCRGWWGGISGVNVKVLAWMPLPVPYGGNEDE